MTAQDFLCKALYEDRRGPFFCGSRRSPKWNSTGP